jgi:hypothetical protein
MFENWMTQFYLKYYKYTAYIRKKKDKTYLSCGKSRNMLESVYVEEWYHYGGMDERM